MTDWRAPPVPDQGPAMPPEPAPRERSDVPDRHLDDEGVPLPNAPPAVPVWQDAQRIAALEAQRDRLWEALRRLTSSIESIERKYHMPGQPAHEAKRARAALEEPKA